MIIEALENAMNYAKRAKISVLRSARDEIGRRKDIAGPGKTVADPATPPDPVKPRKASSLA